MLTIDALRHSTHTLKAESQLDLARFLLAASEPTANIRLVGVAIADGSANNGSDENPQYVVFIETSAALSDIRGLIQRITDSHVMRQSLAFTYAQRK